MSHGYRVVSWTPFKKRFDAWMLGGLAAYLASFVGVSALVPPAGQSFAPLQILIRATGTLAFLMLGFVLSIGPLARLSPRFKPVLYNRRHLGVATFVVALVHAVLVVVWYHGFGVINPLVSLLVSNPRYDALAGFPFESLGVVALLLLFLLAATSHDFWNANLGPGLWKGIHMSVYVAFVLLVGHVALGALQTERQPAYAVLLAAAALGVGGLQIAAARRGATQVLQPEASASKATQQGWLRVGPAADIPDARAIVVGPPRGERIAVFRDGMKISAVSNVCRHQGGPLGEGRVIDGCITCPWHGYQYRMEDGCSPPPFTERIATYATRIREGVVYVDLMPQPPGTPVAPSIADPVEPPRR